MTEGNESIEGADWQKVQDEATKAGMSIEDVLEMIRNGGATPDSGNNNRKMYEDATEDATEDGTDRMAA